MPIFEQGGTKVLFIHIPKSGGTSIENMLKQYVTMTFHSPIPSSGLKVCPQHLQINDFRILFNQVPWNWIFTVVRNPYDRVESEYFYRTEDQLKKIGMRVNFSQWVVNNLTNAMRNRFLFDNHLRPQTDFIDGDVEVFKYEDGLHHIFPKLEEHFDIPEPLKLPHDNRSTPSEIQWTNEALNLVADFYKDDFKQLNYSVRAPVVQFSEAQQNAKCA
ncbi:hypothetical protein AB833_31455 [Chromatiales bacterium (ex Bugula neritina AB1)]|nr:hypothetical protein AB833_31455 [Chromatiales bacterium (ex Bugula neritina AB1)]